MAAGSVRRTLLAMATSAVAGLTGNSASKLLTIPLPCPSFHRLGMLLGQN